MTEDQLIQLRQFNQLSHPYGNVSGAQYASSYAQLMQNTHYVSPSVVGSLSPRTSSQQYNSYEQQIIYRQLIEQEVEARDIRMQLLNSNNAIRTGQNVPQSQSTPVDVSIVPNSNLNTIDERYIEI